MPQTYILWCNEMLLKGLNWSLHVNQWHILGKEQTYTCNKWLDVVFRMSMGFVQVHVVSEYLSNQCIWRKMDIYLIKNNIYYIGKTEQLVKYFYSWAHNDKRLYEYSQVKISEWYNFCSGIENQTKFKCTYGSYLLIIKTVY